MAVLTGSLQGHLATDPLSKCSWWSIARSTPNIVGPMMQRWYATVTLFRLLYGVRLVFMFLNLKGLRKCCQSVYPATNVHNKTQLTQVSTLYLLTWRIWWAPNNASKGQMGFNSAFKELKYYTFRHRGDIFKALQDLWVVSCNVYLLVDMLTVRIDTAWIISNSQMFRHRILSTQCLNVGGN